MQPNADFEGELRFHIEMRTAELVASRGLDEAAARVQALREFGDVEDARQYISAMDRHSDNAMRRRERMESIWQDVMRAWRSLRRKPGFAVVVVLALALGIGATTAVFTLVNAVLLRPLPGVSHPEQLVGFGDPSLTGINDNGPPRTDIFSYQLYTELRDGTQLVPTLFASGYSSRLDVILPEPTASGGEAERAAGRLVSGNYFEVLGVRTAVGRTLTMEDDRPGAPPVAVISHSYWRRRFDLDPAVVGRTMLVNRAALTIVGVTPTGFVGEIGGRGADVWLPINVQPLILPNQNWLTDRNTNWLLLMGRLRPGATPAQAGVELTAMARQAIVAGAGASAAPDAATLSVAAYTAARGFVGVPQGFRSALISLLTLTGLVLLVVGANVANLLLARAATRQAEVGVHLALGASRLRVMRHLITESVLLGAIAGVLAILVLQSGKSLLLRQIESGGGSIPLDLSLDVRVVGFAAALTLVTSVLLGLTTAVRLTRVDLALALRSNVRGSSGDPLGGTGRRLGLGKWLVIGQVAVSLVLLAGAGLLMRSVDNLRSRDVGLARDELLIVSVDAHAAGYNGAGLQAFIGQLAERMQAIPGVRAVSYSQNGIFSGIESRSTLQVPGYVARTAEDTSAYTDHVGAGYFRTIGARMLRGRDIETRDDARSPRVAVINEAMARFYFANRDPIGESFRVDTTRYEIVGVVADVLGQDLHSAAPRRYYTAIAQGDVGGLIVFELRMAGNPAQAADAARREVFAANSLLRVRTAQPLSNLMRESIMPEILLASLCGVAGGLALALAALGLYGVMTYAIARRTSEFGLRIALGARPSDVTRMVLRETMVLFLVGTAIGIPLALGVAVLLRHQLVGIGFIDVPTLITALVVLGASAFLAGYRPASRAGRVAPQTAIRWE
jgi:predicted permease